MLASPIDDVDVGADRSSRRSAGGSFGPVRPEA
jgi:hypothetical protein